MAFLMQSNSSGFSLKVLNNGKDSFSSLSTIPQNLSEKDFGALCRSGCRPNCTLNDITIFYRTYSIDAIFLPYSLFSIETYIPSLRDKICISYPGEQEDKVREALGAWVDTVQHILLTESGETGYEEQQYTKLSTDLLIDAPLIMHVDSDVVFQTKITDADILDPATGRPWWYVTPYDWLKGLVRWRRGTAAILGLRVDELEYEFMRRFPFVIPTELFHLARKCIARAHGGLPIQDLMRIKFKGVLGVHQSEYNILGASAYHCGGQHLLSFVKDSKEKSPFPRPLVKQFDSYNFTKQNVSNMEHLDKVFCEAMHMKPKCLNQSKYLIPVPTPTTMEPSNEDSSTIPIPSPTATEVRKRKKRPTSSQSEKTVEESN